LTLVVRNIKQQDRRRNSHCPLIHARKARMASQIWKPTKRTVGMMKASSRPLCPESLDVTKWNNQHNSHRASGIKLIKKAVIHRLCVICSPPPRYLALKFCWRRYYSYMLFLLSWDLSLSFSMAFVNIFVY